MAVHTGMCSIILLLLIHHMLVCILSIYYALQYLNYCIKKVSTLNPTKALEISKHLSVMDKPC